MNAQQRKYLVDKITQKVKDKIKELEAQRVEIPSIASYMMHQIMSDKFIIKDNMQLRAIIKDKALKGLSSSRPENFLGSENSWTGENRNKIILTFEELFDLPTDYQLLLDKARKENNNIRQECNLLRIQAESLETRIMLASDKTLEKMINEVDDMGDISLIDTKIKLLN